MMQRRTALLSLLITTTLLACGGKQPPNTAIPAGATVLALGDSLTAGVGAQAGEDWPTLLAEATGWHVVNAGVSGNTSAQGLARLPALLNDHQPSLVIVGLGGNDFLRRIPVEHTQQALTQIVRDVQASGAQVVLVAIPQPSLLVAAGVTPSDHPMYESLAKELYVPLIANIWGPILGDANLRADQVHANAQGYAQFAQALQAALRRLGLLTH